MTSGKSGLVLASASSIRQTLLRNAGIEFESDPANIDEGKLKIELKAQQAGAEMAAIELAAHKAQAVSARQPNKLVIGADQILDEHGTWFDKPTDMETAARQLERLAGRPHRLVNGITVVEDGVEVWRHADSVTMLMRPLSRNFIDDYLQRAGDAALKSVGGYQLEGFGAQLFERVDGDYFSVLGLPLLPLLAFLRRRGVIPE
jgi:septum formation protein